MKRLIFFLNLLLISVCNAQNIQDTVGVPDFNSKISGTEKYLSILTEKTADIVNSTGRVFLVDLTSGKSVDKVISRAQENYKSNWIDDRSKINPKRILVGEVTVLKFIRVLSTSNPGYKCNLQFVLKVIETESSKILETYEFSGQSNGVLITQESALLDAITSIYPSLNLWVNKSFSLKLGFVKIAKESSKRIEQIILNGGSKLKINSGDKFEIVFLDSSFNPPLPEILGEGEIKDVLNDDYSIFEVIKANNNSLKELIKSNKSSSLIFKSKL
jgi:hypothetical protein